MSEAELELYYRNQLIEAGWELKEKGSNSSIAWSILSFIDQFNVPWSEYLLVRGLGQEKRYVELIINKK